MWLLMHNPLVNNHHPKPKTTKRKLAYEITNTDSIHDQVNLTTVSTLANHIQEKQ